MSEEKVPQILLMWSGGITSTAALEYLLTKKEYKKFDIVVHHLHLRNIFKKEIAEAVACKDILEYYMDKKKYRQFFFSESNHEYNFLQPPRYTSTVYDLDVVNFMAAQICAANSNIKHVIIGSTKTDTEVDEGYKAKLSRSQKILLECLSLEASDLDLSIEYPFDSYTMQQVFATLPNPLKTKVFSCMAPVYKSEQVATPCGKCQKCVLRQKLLDK
jgi:7-cyano-7-deazaguanine synthase in queuosine biosynthesis